MTKKTPGVGFFTIYKITNNINGKYYIGKHQTRNLNDTYMGSGKGLKRAIQKYGIENFTKEILFIFSNEQEMNDKEKELVIISEETYNMTAGGHGGFDYIRRNGLCHQSGTKHPMWGKRHSEETKKHWSVLRKGKQTGSANPMWGKVGPNKGKSPSAETREKYQNH